jgi:toxin-antitoxin system PIN domain toxin
MKGYLLDVNLLIALAWPNHVQHRTAQAWFQRESQLGWGTCSLTQVAFVRISSHPSFDHHVSTQVAFEKLHEIIALQGHVFWPEPDGGYANDGFSRTIPNTLTHNLVTDGFLATVAAANDAKLATLDRRLVRIFPDLAVLVTEPA